MLLHSFCTRNERDGFSQKKLQLLHDITRAFRPGILTALIGVSGAGKTTLMDVLFGRKTGGTVEGDIRIGGYPEVHKTFARISGYCEQSVPREYQVIVSMLKRCVQQLRKRLCHD